MAKRRKGGKRSRKYKNRKRVSAGKRSYRKSGLYKYNMRRKKRRGGKRKRRGGSKRKRRRGGRKTYKRRAGGKKSRKYESRARAAGVSVMSKSKVNDAYRRIIDRGGSEQHARAVVARLERMRKHQIHAGVVAHEAKQKVDAERKKASEFADLFRKIGAEEARRASL